MAGGVEYLEDPGAHVRPSLADPAEGDGDVGGAGSEDRGPRQWPVHHGVRGQGSKLGGQLPYQGPAIVGASAVAEVELLDMQQIHGLKQSVR